MLAYYQPLFLFLFIPLTLILYQIMIRRFRWVVLLLVNLAFFYIMSGKLVGYLIFSILSIHRIGLWIDSIEKEYTVMLQNNPNLSHKIINKHKTSEKRRVLAFGILLHIGILIALKYTGFILSNVNLALNAMDLDTQIKIPDIVAPIGISFYTLQAISYMVDVYRGSIKADRKLTRLALYMSFFPIIMQGPICRYSQVADGLYLGKPIREKNLCFGVQRIIWGMFKKIVIADRLNILVGEVYSNYEEYSGIIIALAVISYTCQLYMEFSGCIDISIGCGEMFGVHIPENFRQPFFSKTVTEFWRRWHITLGTWLKDYVFYPVSLSKKLKKIGKKTKPFVGRYMSNLVSVLVALFCVWICNGLWHGADWIFILYGMYYFILISLSNIFEPLIKKILKLTHINREWKIYKLLQCIRTVILVIFGELFFRADTVADGINMVKKIFNNFDSQQFWGKYGVLELGLDEHDFILIICSLCIVLFVSILHELRVKIRESIAGLSLPFRWGIYYMAIFAVIIFGAYGVGYTPVDMIYAGF